MIKKKILLGLMGLALITSAMAQSAETSQPMRLSLSDAQQYALEHNYTLQNASLDVKKADAARWKNISTMLPQVSAKADYQSMCGYEMDLGEMGKMPLNPTGTVSISAGMSISAQQIMGSFLSTLAKDMSNITRRQTIQTTYSNVKNVYVSILVMEDIVDLLDSSLADMEELERATIASVQAGAAEQVDADKLSVQVASMRNTINANRRSLSLLYNSMILQLGADVNTKIELTTTLDEILNIDHIAQLTMHGFNIENNFDYQKLIKGTQISKNQLNMAWLGFLPSLTGFYQYSAKKYFGEAFMNMTPPNMVGVSVTLPILQSGTRAANVKEAKLSYMETLNSQRQAEDGLQVQYNQLCYDLVSAIESYQIQKKNLEVTQRVFDNVTEKYKYARASNLEVTNASIDIITAQSNYVQAVMTVLNAQISLENLLGENQYNDVVLPSEEKKSSKE